MKASQVRRSAMTADLCRTPGGRIRHGRGVRHVGGFTMLEAMLATLIIGIGFVAMLNLIANSTRANGDGTELITALDLARNIREKTVTQPFATLPALNGTSYMPPTDNRGVTLTQMPNWQQVVTVEPVNPAEVTSNSADPRVEALRLTAVVRHNGEQVTSLTWYEFAR